MSLIEDLVEGIDDLVKTWNRSGDPGEQRQLAKEIADRYTVAADAWAASGGDPTTFRSRATYWGSR